MKNTPQQTNLQDCALFAILCREALSCASSEDLSHLLDYWQASLLDGSSDGSSSLAMVLLCFNQKSASELRQKIAQDIETCRTAYLEHLSQKRRRISVAEEVHVTLHEASAEAVAVAAAEAVVAAAAEAAVVAAAAEAVVAAAAEAVVAAAAEAGVAAVVEEEGLPELSEVARLELKRGVMHVSLHEDDGAIKGLSSTMEVSMQHVKSALQDLAREYQGQAHASPHTLHLTTLHHTAPTCPQLQRHRLCTAPLPPSPLLPTPSPSPPPPAPSSSPPTPLPDVVAATALALVTTSTALCRRHLYCALAAAS